MNPALPLQHYVPDPEARQWGDGRLYVYGSLDIAGDLFWCSRAYRVFSTDDLLHWQDHGESFSTHHTRWGPDWDGATLYAPDCIEHEGRYHLFFCTSANGEGVARSTSPAGPFTDPVPVAGAHGDAIDPAAFVDDDGSVYLYWGQGRTRGARLQPGLAAIDPDTLQSSLLNEPEHGFHEGASVRKRGELYYLVYADSSRGGRPTCLGYATAPAPLGPYTKRGIIVDNAACDPDSWNNHGSIASFNGQWYVFYHRSTQASQFNRRMCIEPIAFNADGTIDEVKMTTSGVSGPLDPTRPLAASRACELRGHVRVMPLPAGNEEPPEVLGAIKSDDAACYRSFDFGNSPRRFTVSAASATYGGDIEIRQGDPQGPTLGICPVARTGAWTRFAEFSCDLEPIEGVQELWLVFKGRDGRLFDLRTIRFTA
jgi:hypothetical protein